METTSTAEAEADASHDSGAFATRLIGRVQAVVDDGKDRVDTMRNDRKRQGLLRELGERYYTAVTDADAEPLPECRDLFDALAGIDTDAEADDDER